MGLTALQQRFLADLYAYLAQHHGICIAPLRVSTAAVQNLDAIEDGWSMNVNLARNYASEYACDCRELIQNFRDQCAELSRTHSVCLFMDGRTSTMQTQAANMGISQLFFVIEDLQGGQVDTSTRSSATPLSCYWESATGRPFVLGHIMEYQDAAGTHCLDICNHCTLLNPSILSLGVSEKSKKPYTAGHFGEGMKVQINRLLADSKCDGITYITGRCKWDFKHMQAQHCTNDTLHVLSMRLTVHHGHPSRDRDHMEETICTVRGYKTQPAVDPGCYLFLQPQPSMMPVPMSSTPPQATQTVLQLCPSWYSSIRVQGPADGANPAQEGRFGVEFLFDAAFHGNFYLHGILFKKKLDGLVGMGINFCGSTQLLMKYELNRDRNCADLPNLVSWLVVKAVERLHAERARPGQQSDGRLDFLVAQLYLTMSHPRAGNYGAVLSPLGYLYKYSSLELQQLQVLADKLASLLGVVEGVQDKSPVPVSASTSTQEVAELHLLGHTPVKASKLLIDIWDSAGKVKTMDQLWQVRRAEVENMPDHTLSWGSAERAEADKLLSTVAHLLAPVAKHLKIEPPSWQALRSRMKVLALLSPSCSHDKVVVSFKAGPHPHSTPLLIYEAQFLKSLEAVHSKLGSLEEQCTGPPANGQGPCGCMAELLLSETVTALGQMGVPQHATNKCFQRNCLAMAATKLSLLGSQAAVQPNTSAATPEQSQSTGDHEPTTSTSWSADVETAAPMGGPAPDAYTGTHTPAAAAAAAAAPHVQNGVGVGPVENFPAPVHTASGILGSLATHAQHAPQSHTDPQQPQQQQPRFTTTCECKSTLVASQVQIGVGTAGVPAYLYLPEGGKFNASDQHMIESSASRLYVLVGTLLSSAFGLSLGANRIFVCYDPGSSTIAFNKGKGQQLWFNAAVTVSTRGFSSEGEARVRFWFLVCAHELAHNTVSGHDSDFSDVCSSIVLQYAGAYEAFARTWQHLY